MANYPLREHKDVKNLLVPVNYRYLSNEAVEKRFSHHLRDEYRYDENGKYVRNYRLRVQNPHNIEMGLAYDIKCPQCGHQLKMIGRMIDACTLGLYECPTCKKPSRGNG